MKQRGRPKQFIWRIIAFDILRTVTDKDIHIRTKHLLEQEQLQLIYYPLLNKSFRELMKEIDVEIKLSFKDEKQTENFEVNLLELDKQDSETWATWMNRKQFQTLPTGADFEPEES